MIHHVQRKLIHNPFAINKGMKHWCEMFFIWCSHAADVYSSLFHYIFSLHSTVKDKSNWWFMCPLHYRYAGVAAPSGKFLFSPTDQYIVSLGLKGYKSQEVSTSLPWSRSTQPRRLSEYLGNLWPLASGEARSFCQSSLWFTPLCVWASGFKFTISTAQTCWDYPILHLQPNPKVCACKQFSVQNKWMKWSK